MCTTHLTFRCLVAKLELKLTANLDFTIERLVRASVTVRVIGLAIILSDTIFATLIAII